jgi:hypothetical protein
MGATSGKRVSMPGAFALRTDSTPDTSVKVAGSTGRRWPGTDRQDDLSLTCWAAYSLTVSGIGAAPVGEIRQPQRRELCAARPATTA